MDLIFICLLATSHLALCQCYRKRYLQSVPENTSVELSCDSEQTHPNKWLYERTVLCFNRACLDNKFGTTAVLFNNYSLFFKHISLQDEGNYVCSHNGTIVVEHFVTVIGLSYQCFTGFFLVGGLI